MSIRYSPYQIETASDPYPFYERLREEAPVFRNDEDDFWALSRHADVVDALRDSDRFSSGYGFRLDPGLWGPEAPRLFSFLAMDPPEHGRMRGLVNRAFTAKRVAALEPRVRELVRLHLEPALARGNFDLVTDLAAVYPMDVISELVGVPAADRPKVRDLGIAIMHREEGEGAALPPRAQQALGELIGYYTGLIAERSRHRQDDLISALLDAADGDDRLTVEEIVGILVLLVGAGTETTMHLLGNAWYAAWRHPDQRAKAFAGRVEAWVEETLRYEPPGQTTARLATEDIRLHDITIPAGGRVLLLIGSANRDPRVFPDPDRFDLDRDTRQAVTFGSGRHFCLGAELGRLEAEIALGELAARVSDFSVDVDRMRWTHSPNARGFTSLPTEVTPRT